MCSFVETSPSLTCHVSGLWIPNTPRYFFFDWTSPVINNGPSNRDISPTRENKVGEDEVPTIEVTRHGNQERTSYQALPAKDTGWGDPVNCREPNQTPWEVVWWHTPRCQQQQALRTAVYWGAYQLRQEWTPGEVQGLDVPTWADAATDMAPEVVRGLTFTGKKMERQTNRHLRRWLGSRSASPWYKLHSRASKIQLPLSSILEEFETGKVRLIMTLNDSGNEIVSKAGIDVRTGRKWSVGNQGSGRGRVEAETQRHDGNSVMGCKD